MTPQPHPRGWAKGAGVSHDVREHSRTETIADAPPFDGKPWLDDGDVRLYHGDCLDVLRQLPDRSVHMCATSPPFYGLRDYGTGSWEGGEPDCDHRVESSGDKKRRDEGRHNTGTFMGSKNVRESLDLPQFRDVCGKCGARRVDRQIGLEETPEQWVERLVEVFREVRRVLRDDGTLWVEIGDSYTAAGSDWSAWKGGQTHSNGAENRGRKHPTKPKDLLGQPWLLAFALRADGWFLRSEIIWARPNPMPESVTDRPTKAHSTVFLLSKSARYFYDADAIREAYADHRNGDPGPAKTSITDTLASGSRRFDHDTKPKNSPGRVVVAPQAETLDGSSGEAPRGPDGRRVTQVVGGENSEQHRNGERWPNPTGANARSVWQIPTEPTPFAHFATWPQALVRRMVLAGTSEKGCCPECGAPWVRQTETRYEKGGAGGPTGGKEDANGRTPRLATERLTRIDLTIGWSPSCDCLGYRGHYPSAPVPCTVLDPFAGSATTMLVARNHGRHAVGIELNEQYLEIAAKRLQQLSLFTSSEGGRNREHLSSAKAAPSPDPEVAA